MGGESAGQDRGHERTDGLEDPTERGRSGGETVEGADDEADERGRRHLALPPAEEARGGRRGDAEAEDREPRGVGRRRFPNGRNLAQRLGGRPLTPRHGRAKRVEASQPSEVDPPWLDPHVKGALVRSLTEGGDDRGGGGEELARKAEAKAHLGERFLEAVGRVAVRVQGLTQGEDEGSGGLARASGFRREGARRLRVHERPAHAGAVPRRLWAATGRRGPAKGRSARAKARSERRSSSWFPARISRHRARGLRWSRVMSRKPGPARARWRRAAGSGAGGSVERPGHHLGQVAQEGEDAIVAGGRHRRPAARPWPAPGREPPAPPRADAPSGVSTQARPRNRVGRRGGEPRPSLPATG